MAKWIMAAVVNGAFCFNVWVRRIDGDGITNAKDVISKRYEASNSPNLGIEGLKFIRSWNMIQTPIARTEDTKKGAIAWRKLSAKTSFSVV